MNIKFMKILTHHNTKSMGDLSLFLCNEMVPSGGNDRQRHPKCIAYVQSTPLLCFGGCHSRKPCFTQIRCWKRQQGFHCFVCDLWAFCHDFYPEHRQSCCLKHSLKTAVICYLQQLFFFLHGHAGFSWFIEKWVTDPFLVVRGSFEVGK